MGLLFAVSFSAPPLWAATARRADLGSSSDKLTSDGAVIRQVNLPATGSGITHVATVDWTRRQLRVSASGFSSLSVGEVTRLLPQSQSRADAIIRDIFEKAVGKLPLGVIGPPTRSPRSLPPSLPELRPLALQNTTLESIRLGYPARDRSRRPSFAPDIHSGAAELPPSLAADDAIEGQGPEVLATLMPLLRAAVGRYQAEQTTFLANGGVLMDVRLSLDGGQEGLGEFWQQVRDKLQPKPDALPRSAALMATEPAPHSSRAAVRVTSGLVIQAKGLGVRPCLWPRLFDRDGALIFGAETLDAAVTKTRGVAGFSTSLEAALRDPRVAEQAAVVRATERLGDGCSDLVVDSADLPEHSQLLALLEDARVMIVLDDPAVERGSGHQGP